MTTCSTTARPSGWVPGAVAMVLALLAGVVAASPASAQRAPVPDDIVLARGDAAAVSPGADIDAVAATASPDGGLWLVDAAGRVLAAGAADDHGDLAGEALNLPVVGIAATASGDGYWLVASDGGVFAFGDARFHGSTGNLTLNEPIVGMAPTASGDGYWLVASDGGVFAFGDAPFHGSMGGIPLNQPMVGIAETPSGEGYWLVASDGGVFAFGDAPFLGSDIEGTVPVVDMSGSPSGAGYWVVQADGVVRVAGDSEAVQGPNPTGRVVAVVPTPTGRGYWLVTTGVPELPQGGTAVFEGGRMMVALYGSPVSPLLGVLGETGPEAAAERVIARADEYRAAGQQVLPAMEIITTVANSFPGSDGNYSTYIGDDELVPWLDAAEAAGIYVFLDLQPGRANFLTQARVLEEHLLRPGVGLALDPEWRMGPGEVPGQTIGSVDASEINSVTAWLDELVEREGLPEKLFVIHQFTESMITNRAAVVDRPNLAVTFHADGFGGVEAKLGTYRRHRGEPPFFTGFKLFLDEDTGLLSPEETVAIEPRPDLVTYQ